MSFTTPANTTGFSFSGGGAGDVGGNKPEFGTPTFGGTSSFGAAPAPATNFGLGSTLSQQAPASGFSLGGQTSQPSTGFGLGGTTTASPGFGFGGGAPAATSAPPSFGLGGAAPAASSAGGFSFGGQPVSSAASNFNLGSVAKSTPSSAPGGGFNFAAPVASSAASTPGTGFSLGGNVATTTSAPAASSTGFSFGGTTTSTTTTTLGLSFGQNAATTTKPAASLSFGTLSTATNATTPSTGFSLAAKTTAPTSSTTTVPTATSIAPTATTVAPAAPGSSQSFADLEESINKWTLELEEQEKVFMNQALQLNAWDRLLIQNGDKIIELNSEVERVKQDQQQLDHELDFVVAQQRELEELIKPLEKELENIPTTDPDRQHIYQLAENMDSQLKQMSEDLKEIIEHLNESNRAEDANDPIVQIGRILNAHMNSLQWIDQNTALIGNHLDQVAKLYETHRREHERSFHLTYE